MPCRYMHMMCCKTAICFPVDPFKKQMSAGGVQVNTSNTSCALVVQVDKNDKSQLTCLLYWKKHTAYSAPQRGKLLIQQASWGNRERYTVPTGGGSSAGLLFKIAENALRKTCITRMWARLRATTRFEKMRLGQLGRLKVTP